MEKDLAALSLDDEEEEIIHIQKESNSDIVEEYFYLTGCFLTANIIYFPTMRSKMANLWHPIKGVQISNPEEKRFLLRFFHRTDLERVLKGSPWTFNNHLLILHQLMDRDDPLKVPLIYANFWVQIHEVPLGFFSEALERQIGDFIGKFIEYNGSNLGKGVRHYLRIRVKLDVRKPLKRKKKILFSSGICSYVSFKYERLTLFCFFCGRLGHSDSFFHSKMELGFEVAEIGWNLSILAQSRRALAMNSVWLRDDGREIQ
ncbi:uncharacterized protein [Gossypium hirsutum]|uniref:Nucleolin-like n=1 Tax=Gossypium hirsutum TaxID=3635 RepID=A0A1U8NWD1_GOSHI|nr:uncharacterized protein LOC107952428 [Gossypium hirsutum]